MTLCDSYVLRIYRRDAAHPEKVVGVVEIVGQEEKQAFTDSAGLWAILRAEVKSGGKKRGAQPKAVQANKGKK